MSHGKPAPDGYRSAAEKLGFAAARTVVFEDSTAGAKAGAAAGATVIGVGQRGLATDATIIVRDLRGLTWRDGVLSLAAADLLRFCPCPTHPTWGAGRTTPFADGLRAAVLADAAPASAASSSWAGVPPP